METYTSYKNNLKNTGMKGSRILIILLLIVYLVITLFSISISEILNDNDIFGLRAAFLVLLVIFIFLTPYSYNSDGIKNFGLLIFSYGSFPSLY